ncbi:MAG: phosphate ABC transporter permease PstA [Candidatus Cloacimonetes bacterium]|nr:phosphate ABC transporter permease PstA [Candidatus Cloacimonadota bacterium]
MQQASRELLAHLDYIIEAESSEGMSQGFYDGIHNLRSAVRRRFKDLLEERMVVTPSALYGRTRWDGRTRYKLGRLLAREKMYYPMDEQGNIGMGEAREVSRARDFAGTSLEPFFGYIESNAKELLSPRFTFYWRFLFDPSKDSHMLGGIWAEILGTLYLTVGAMLFAVPLGVVAAIYLSEYAPEGRLISLLRTCISTLAGVPSIVFGLFGLAFFINTLKVSQGRSVLAGSMTLAILILPTIIRASEEAIRAVPLTYREAALSLGASRLHMVTTVVLPAALPGILTGIVISMGRAAGETAPIIFTAAISFGDKLRLSELLTNGTRVLSWNIYNLASEHPEVDEIRHVQYGMVMVLIALVVLLNMTAIVIRARISRKLRG